MFYQVKTCSTMRAWLLHNQYRDFDLLKFRDDLLGENGKEAFRKDVQDSKYLGINRFPTLVIKRMRGPAVMLAGYQTYESLKAGMGVPNHAPA